VAAAELQDSFSKITDYFMVFCREELRRSHQGASPPLGAARRGARPSW
jgi:hypothetical protein